MMDTIWVIPSLVTTGKLLRMVSYLVDFYNRVRLMLVLGRRCKKSGVLLGMLLITS